MDASDPARDAIHDAIQEHAPRGQDAVLTGWVMVAEWIDHQGERWLTKGHSQSTANWAASGMYHEALYGEWPSPDD